MTLPSFNFGSGGAWRSCAAVALAAFFLAGCGALPRQQAKNAPLWIQAARSLKQAHSLRLPAEKRAGYYLDAAAEASGVFDSGGPADGRARALYNRASAELTALLHDNRELWHEGARFESPGGNGSYRLAFRPASPGGEVWNPNYFTALKPASEVGKRGIRQQVGEPGFGGALVGIRKTGHERGPKKSFAPRSGSAAPVTATLDFHQSRAKPGAAMVRNVTLTLNDPTKRERAPINGVNRPLAADFTAPLAHAPRYSEFWMGLAALIQVEKYLGNSGLYMLAPYDPNRLPVIFVHGLASTQQMWVNTINEIESDPELRRRCQYWVFSYPTGNPLLYSSMQLREDLATVQRLYPMRHGCVIVGHSFGGLIARTEATTTGRALWDANLGKKANRFYARLPPESLLKRVLIFESVPEVRRLVFICTPHRGSDLAIGSLGMLVTRFITLPATLISNLQNAIGGSFETITGIKGTHWPTSIQSLSPRSATLKALEKLPIEAPYHSIIGDRGRGDTPNSSDGVVPYRSSHLAGAESELIVPGPHGSYELPQTIAEIRRILHVQLDGKR